MSGQTVELASAKWLSPEQATELGAGSAETGVSDQAPNEAASGVPADAHAVAATTEQAESTVKTLLLAVVVGAAAFGVAFAFPTGSSSTSEAPAPAAGERPATGESGDATALYDAVYEDDGLGRELSDAEVMEMAAEIAILNAKRAKAGK